jgi:hypothetical protein
MRPGTTSRAVAALACGLVLAGCNSATSTLGTLPAAALTLTPLPNPILATAATTPGYQYNIQWSLSIQETAGIGGTLHYITSSLYDPTTGAKVAFVTLGPTELVAQYGTDQIAPSGTLKVQQQLNYSVAGGTKGALLSIEVELKDTNGNLIDPAVLVEVE